jgi:penicillin-binding protein 1A
MIGAFFRGFFGGLGAWFGLVRKNFKKKPFRRGVLLWLLAMGLFPLVGAIGVGVTVVVLWRTLPSLESMERIEPSLITKVYDKDERLVHEFYIQRRIWKAFDAVPEMQKNAVFAIEDRDFYKHWGVSLSAYPSALLPALIGHRVRGASTLTQQLAKNLFLTPERSILRKIRELLVALRIEQTYTKQEILEFYFNQVYLGGGAYGFAAASERFFSKPLDSLSIAQYALLAGMLKAPEGYRPDYHAEVSRERRNVVLGAMRSTGCITKQQWQQAVKSDLDVKPRIAEEGLGAYYIETVRQFLEKKWNEDFVYNQGASVYTALDSALQRYCDSVIVANVHHVQVRMKYRTARRFDMMRIFKQPVDTLVRHWDDYYPRFDSLYMRKDTNKLERKYPDSLRYHKVQSALLLLDNETGAVRALVGGEDFDVSKYNRALQAVRSPGSSFKPFVYATAVDNGASPSMMLNDQPITIPDPVDPTKMWRPQNFEPEFEGRMPMRRALYRSKNLPAIELAMKYGLNNVSAYAKKFGLNHNVPPVPSLAIGSCEATLMEMTSAYTVFPNGGVRPMPFFVNKVIDKNGTTLFQNLPQTQEVLKPEAAWIMIDMMKDVNIRGTAASIWASGFNHPSGGKTGTTNDYTDAWYVGYTKRYTLGVWVGADDHTPMGPGHTGADDAVPVWIAVMKFAHKGLKILDFPRPQGVVQATICQESGLLAQPFCKATVTDWFISGYAPEESCTPEHHARASVGTDISNANRHRDPPPGAGNPQGKGSKIDARVRKTF